MVLSFPHPAGLIFLLLIAWCAIYARVLNGLQDRYAPDWTWVTVVIGNSAILEAMAVLASFDLIAWAAWWYLFWGNVASGTPIVIWQVGQFVRKLVRRRRFKREETAHGAYAARRSRGH